MQDDEGASFFLVARFLFVTLSEAKGLAGIGAPRNRTADASAP
jgi:hypothetical protein